VQSGRNLLTFRRINTCLHFVGYLHDLLFHPEYGGSTLLRNVGKEVPDYTALYTGRQDLLLERSRYSDWLRAGRRKSRSSSPGRVKNFVFSTSSRPALGPTQPPIQWVPGIFPRGVKLTTHLKLVPRSRKRGSIHPLPHTPSWRSA
jgi:hypothetical protein